MWILYQGVKVGENASERHSQTRHFCNLAFPGLKECFSPWERTFLGRKDSFIGMRRILMLLKFSNELINLNFIKITAWLEIQGACCNSERSPQIFTGGPGTITIPTTLTLPFNPWLYPVLLWWVYFTGFVVNVQRLQLLMTLVSGLEQICFELELVSHWLHCGVCAVDIMPRSVCVFGHREVCVIRCSHLFFFSFVCMSEVAERIWMKFARPITVLCDTQNWLCCYVINSAVTVINFCQVCSYLFPSVLWHCWLGDRKGILDVGLLMVTIWLELCTSYSSACHHSPPPSSLAPIKSRMETFWYRLTQTNLEKWPLIWRQTDMQLPFQPQNITTFWLVPNHSCLVTEVSVRVWTTFVEL